MKNSLYQQGFSLVELMIAIVLGLIVNYAVVQVYLAQTQVYKTANSQNLILNTENAITQLVTPVIRSTGFLGCGSTSSAISNLNAGGPNPLGTFGTTPIMVYGYNGSAASYTLTQGNPANDNTAADWSPTLHSSLVGQVQKGNDVLTVLGAAPYSQPVTVTTIDSSSSSFTVQSIIGSNVVSGQFASISDCVKSIVFIMTGVSGTTITHNSGAGTLQNTASLFPVNFQVGA
ncbi:MAG: prepilin-type N-terminal cleavage/methylation domain-containing protein, partial [bacterium]|nr:prepilin-type N-terminal cleavage/methylation domain-containing protein [bacterium]